MIKIHIHNFIIIFSDNRYSLSWKVDSPNNVLENWKKFKKDIGFDQLNIAFLSQIHSAKAVVAYKSGYNGTGDALITRKNSFALCVFVADCVPIVMAEPISQTIAAIHAGWRSLAKGIIENTAHKLKSIGANIENINAFIGPSISSCCYEVGEDVFRAFKNHAGNFHRISKSKYIFDIRKTVFDKLHESGIQKIIDFDICTKCSPSFFSHRENKISKRQVALVKIV